MMKTSKTYEATPHRVGILYCVFLILALVLAVPVIGTETILMSAMASKPYSVLLHSAQFFSLISEYHEPDTPQEEGRRLKVICFGDSNSFYPPDTIVPRIGNRKIHLAGLLQESAENSHEGTPLRFSEWAYGGATMFDFYCLFYEAERFSPDLIVVPINWISFGSAWMDDPSFHRPELSALVPIRSELPSTYEDPLRAAGISAIDQLEYRIDLYMLYPIGIKFWVLDEFRSIFYPHAADDVPGPAESTANAFPGQTVDEGVPRTEGKFQPWGNLADTHFPMKIERSHPVLRNIRAFSYIASRHGTKLLFFIWPLDVEYLADTGVLDMPSLEHSKQLIKEATEADGENVRFVDLSDALEDKYFYDRRGHCMIEGRRRITQFLLPEIINMLKPASGRKSFAPEETKEGVF